MAKRKIIKIDESKCNGCGLCIPNCPEGALKIIEGKARLVSDLFCDGLGACLGHCPQGAIHIEEREAGTYSEKEVMGNVIKQGSATVQVHLAHLKSHQEERLLKEALDYLKRSQPTPCACPGSKVVDLRTTPPPQEAGAIKIKRASCLGHWPVQLMLVNPGVPFLKEADLLIAADCVPFSYAAFHEDLLKNKALLVGCPKLDDIGIYRTKIQQIVDSNNLKSITYAHMEVPCCLGLAPVIKEAIAACGRKIPYQEVTISIKGEMIT